MALPLRGDDGDEWDDAADDEKEEDEDEMTPLPGEPARNDAAKVLDLLSSNGPDERRTARA